MSPILFVVLCLTIYGSQYVGSQCSNNHLITYDLKITNTKIHYITDNNSTIRNCDGDNLVFKNLNDHEIYNIGELVRVDKYCNHFIGKVFNINENYIMLKRVSTSSLIQKGHIHIYPDIKCDNYEKQLCFGFNVNSETCFAPKEKFILFDNKYIHATCDNCFVKFETTAYIDIELEWFAIKMISGGFKNMRLSGGIGFDVNGQYQWSYSYDKDYKIVDHFVIADFDIGFIHINSWIDIPVKLLFNAHANVEGLLKTGVNMNWALDGIYFTYTPNEGFKIVTPSGEPKFVPYIDTHVGLEGNANLQITPEIKFYVNDIFELDLRAKPHIDENIKLYQSEPKICIFGTCGLIMDYRGKIDLLGSHTEFGPTEFYNNEQKLDDVCLPLKSKSKILSFLHLSNLIHN
jgi:hypothetical protein